MSYSSLKTTQPGFTLQTWQRGSTRGQCRSGRGHWAAWGTGRAPLPSAQGLGHLQNTPEMFWSILCLPVSAHQGFEHMAAASLPSASLILSLSNHPLGLPSLYFPLCIIQGKRIPSGVSRVSNEDTQLEKCSLQMMINNPGQENLGKDLFSRWL